MGILHSPYRRRTCTRPNIARALDLEKKGRPELRLVQFLLHMDTVFDHLLSIVRTRVYTALETGRSELFRLYAGQQTGPEPSWNICRTQAALVYAVPILYVLQMPTPFNGR
jgi:hypothetical protein